jgi:hypothetical protein
MTRRPASGDFGRGDEARQPPADHDYVRIDSHRVIPRG